ncbi:MAG: alpha/beta fold hydrolase [Ignavibacteriaceae bacterium]
MKTNGISVHTYGDKKNPAIIFVHGFVYDTSMWLKQIKHFQHNYYCVAYDIRGMGNSDVGDGQYTMDSHVDDLFDVITESGIDKPVLTGLSMGGYISLRAVERDESKFSKLILLDTKSDADNNEGKFKRANGVKQINHEGLDAFLEGFIPNCFSDRFKKEELDQFESYMLAAKRANPVGVKGCLISMQGRGSTTEYLPKIKLPALVLCGENDKLAPVEGMKSMSLKIKNAEFKIVPGAGHMSPIENHVFVNTEIEKFFLRD